MSATTERQSSLRALQLGGSSERTALTIILVNIAILFMRPQSFLPFLATIKLPFIISTIPVFLLASRLTRLKGKQVYAMVGFMIHGAFWTLFAVNNRLAFEGLRNLAQLYFFLIFPCVVYFTYGRSFSRLRKVLTLCAFYLSLYSVLHAGYGPGDFMSDENDMCLVLVMLLPFAILPILAKGSVKEFLGTVLVGVIILAGVVATMSRGGFVGLLFAGAYVVLKSPRRLPILFASVLILFVGVFSVPQSYWNEMSTITDTKESTAVQRFDFWGAAFRVFIQPENIVAGIGMKNLPVHIGRFETSTGRSMWGRAVHSVYFQILPETGLIGVFLFLLLVGSSFFGNLRNEKSLARAVRSVKIPVITETSRTDDLEGKKYLVNLRDELLYLRSWSVAMNASWLGTLSAGAFLSIFYYPPIWLLAGWSLAHHNYCRKVLATIETNDMGEKPTTNHRALDTVEA